jgi:hypothetical protein
MKKFGWPLFYLFIFSLLVYNSFSYLDPDFGWHLRFGEIIWQTKSLPHDQIFMWTLPGKTWVDHEWLANLILYILWSLGGYILVSLFFAALLLVTIFIINNYLFKNFVTTLKSQITLAVVEIIAIIGMTPHFGVRVQEITFFATSLLFIIFSNSQKNRSRLPPWWLPIFFYAWACLHAGFLIGLTFLCIWICCEIILFYFPTIQKRVGLEPLTKQMLFFWVVISGLSFISTLITPYGISLYHFLTDYRDTFYQSHIKEWLSPFSFPIHYLQIGLNLLVIVTSLGTIFSLRKKIPLFHYVIIGLLIILAFKSVRHFPLLMAGWIILILPNCLFELTEKIKFSYTKFILPLTLGCLVIISSYILIFTKFTTSPFTAYCGSYPCGAALFLKNNPEITKNMLNAYNFGGYLIGVAPELRLFIDGRLPQYPFKGHSILEEYYQFFQPDLSRKKLNEHQISTVFVQKFVPNQKNNWFEKYILGLNNENIKPGEFLYHLHSSSNWEKVYEDSLSLIYVRK